MAGLHAPHPPFHVLPASLVSNKELDSEQRTIRRDLLTYYLAAIEAMDMEIGRILNSIPRTEKDNTIVIFLGDNGTPRRVIQSPFTRNQGKGTLFEGGIHVPMIVSGKGVTRMGEREVALINTTDLFATIAHFAGIELPEYEDSVSFKSLLSKKSEVIRKFVYAELFTKTEDQSNNGWTIRDEKFKLIYPE